MALESKLDSHNNVVDKFHDPTYDYAMTVYDYVLRPRVASAGAFTIVLPPVAEAAGRFYSIVAKAASVLAPITITHKGDSECWYGDINLTGNCQSVLLYSDGLKWYAFSGVEAWPGNVATPAPGTAALRHPVDDRDD